LYDNILSNNPNEYKTEHNRNYIFLKLEEKEERLYQYETFLDESNNKRYLEVLSFGLLQDGELEKAHIVSEKI